MFFQLTNPIPIEPRDPKDVQQWMEQYRVVPQYGSYTGPNLLFLRLLKDLCELSPTYKTVMKARKRFTFGQNVQIIRRGIPGLVIEQEETTNDEQINYEAALRNYGLTLPKIQSLCRSLDEHITQSGNSYLRITRYRDGEAFAYEWKVLHYLHTMYTVSDDPGEEFLLYSKFLGDSQRMNDQEPKLYRATQDGEPLRWMAEEDGTEVAVMHMIGDDEGSDEGEYYNRTDIISILTWLYTDYQGGNHTSKVAGADFVTVLLLAIEGEDPQAFNDMLVKSGADREKVDVFIENARILREAFSSLTTRGNAMGPRGDQSVVELIEYPHGGKPPTPIKMDINRDVKWAESQDNRTVDKICAQLGWDAILTSLRQAAATLGGNMLYDTFVIKNTETVKPRQRYFESRFDGMVSSIMEEHGEPEAITSLGIMFPDVIGELIEQIKPAPSAIGMNNVSAGEPMPENEEDDEA